MIKDFVLINKKFINEIKNTYIFSFSGGGWCGLIYHLGIIEYLYLNNFLDIIKKNNLIALGTSAGSWAALILLYIHKKIVNKEILDFFQIKQQIYNFILNLENNFIGIPIDCENNIKKLFDFFIKKEDTDFIKFINDKLFISISEFQSFFKLKNILVNPKSYNELYNNLIDSSKIPVMINTKNLNRLDGSITNNQPLLPNNEKLNYKKTIKINCLFNYNCDIYPSEFINPIYVCKKPNLDIINKINKLGFNDAKNYNFV